MATSRATPFTLPTSDGRTVSLSEFAGTPVILYFNEGAGCDSCLQQMAYIEQEPGFDEAGIAVLPIVMNTGHGPVVEQEGALDGFVLVDAGGMQVWSDGG